MVRKSAYLALGPIVLLLCGCSRAAKLGAMTVQKGSRSNGIVFYVGGAGPLGNVGFLSVPLGLQDAGYQGYVELVPWQGITTAMDQIDLNSNRGSGIELGEQIRRASYRYHRVPIHIIALSAGTGIATFALESLPEDVRVQSLTLFEVAPLPLGIWFVLVLDGFPTFQWERCAQALAQLLSSRGRP